MVKNHEWYEDQSAIHFISTICRNFRVGKMLGWLNRADEQKYCYVIAGNITVKDEGGV